MGQEKPTTSVIGRRQFLQAAVMGTAAMALSPRPVTKEEDTLSQQDGEEIIGGDLVSIGERYIEIRIHTTTQPEPRRVHTDFNTAYWKGGWTSRDVLTPGDDVLIRAVAGRNLALKVWSNLTRIEGTVVDIGESRGRPPLLTIKPEGHYRSLPLTPVRVGERTLFGDPVAYTLTHKDLAGIDKRFVKPGDYLDVIGEQTSAGVLATTVIVHRDSGKDGEPKPRSLNATYQHEIYYATDTKRTVNRSRDL